MDICYLSNTSNISDQEKEYVTKKITKVKKLLSKYKKDDELRIEVELELDKRNFWRVEVIVKTPKDTYRVEKSKHTIREAVDEVEDALMKQIRRNEEKQLEVNRKNTKKEELIKKESENFAEEYFED